MKPTVILEGLVTRTEERAVTSKKDDKEYVFHNVLIIGQDTMALAQYDPKRFKFSVGELVRVRAGVGSYRQAPQFDVEQVLDADSAPATSKK